MAFLPKSEKEKEEDKKKVSSPQAGQMTQDGGGELTAGQPKTSGSFSNIQAYLDANKAQGQQLAEDVKSGVTEDIKDYQTAEKSFKERVGQQSQTMNPNQNILGKVSRGESLGDDERQTFQKHYAQQAGQRGLSDFSEYSDAANKAKQAQQSIDFFNAPDTAQQEQLINQQYGRNNYSQGQRELDRALFGQHKTNIDYDPLQDFSTAAIRAGQQLDWANLSDQQLGDVYRQTYEDAAAKFQPTKDYDALAAAESQRIVDEGDFGAMGLTQDQYDILKGSGYDFANLSQRQAGDMVTEQDRANRQAYNNLLSLLGQETSQAPTNMAGTPEQLGVAQQYTQNYQAAQDARNRAMQDQFISGRELDEIRGFLDPEVANQLNLQNAYNNLGQRFSTDERNQLIDALNRGDQSVAGQLGLDEAMFQQTQRKSFNPMDLLSEDANTFGAAQQGLRDALQQQAQQPAPPPERSPADQLGLSNEQMSNMSKYGFDFEDLLNQDPASPQRQESVRNIKGFDQAANTLNQLDQQFRADNRITQQEYEQLQQQKEKIGNFSKELGIKGDPFESVGNRFTPKQIQHYDNVLNSNDHGARHRALSDLGITNEPQRTELERLGANFSPLISENPQDADDFLKAIDQYFRGTNELAGLRQSAMADGQYTQAEKDNIRQQSKPYKDVMSQLGIPTTSMEEFWRGDIFTPAPTPPPAPEVPSFRESLGDIRISASGVPEIKQKEGWIPLY